MEGDTVYESLGEIATAAFKSGDKLESIDNNGDNSAIGYRITRAGTTVEVFSHPTLGGFMVRNEHRLTNELGRQITLAEANQLLTDTEKAQNEEDWKRMYLAAQKRVCSISDGELKDAYKEASPHATHDIEYNYIYSELNDTEYLDGVEVIDRIYPQEASFSTRRYDKAVRTVRHVGITMFEELVSNLEAFDSDVDLGEGGDVDPGSEGRAFH